MLIGHRQAFAWVDEWYGKSCFLKENYLETQNFVRHVLRDLLIFILVVFIKIGNIKESMFYPSDKTLGEF